MNAQRSQGLLSSERRGSAMVSTSACHAGGRGSLPGPGIRDCLSLCLLDETL